MDSQSSMGPPSLAPKSGSKKRSVISLACVVCRKRKTRCDGRRPVCTQCEKTGRSDGCIYDESSDKRRTSHGRQNRALIKRLEEADALFERIRRGGRDAELAILAIRQGKAMDGNIKIEESTTPSEMITPEEAEQKEELASGQGSWKDESGVLTLDEDGQVHYFGGMSNLLEIKSSMKVTGRSQPPGSRPSTSPRMLFESNQNGEGGLTGDMYTVQNVDIPSGLVRYLLDLYFCWQHSYYNIFNKELFLRDLRTGGKFYSKFLLNAVLAHAAQLCDEPLLRSDPSDASTAGYMFFDEAKSLIDSELIKRSVTTVQGLLLLASREAGIGRDTVGWVYSGMAFRMALDLGLHLDCKSLTDCGYLSVEDYEVRNATFWGCYLFDQGWSTYLGRPSIIHMADATVERPEFNYNEQPVAWRPQFAPNRFGEPLPHYPHNNLVAILRLSEIIEETLANLYTPKRALRNDSSHVNGKVKMLYDKLMDWEAKLPQSMKSPEASDHPAVIMLYTLFFATKVFLFRPFVKVKDASQSNTGALNQCLDSGWNIMLRLRRFKKLYSLRLATNLSVYITFTASTVSLFQQDDQSRAQLHECLEFLNEIGETWTSAKAVAEGIQNRINTTTTEATEQQLMFAPFAVGAPTYFESMDLMNFDFSPDFDFLMGFQPGPPLPPATIEGYGGRPVYETTSQVV